MKPLVSENQARLTYLKRKLARRVSRRVSRSKFFDSRCHYTAPKSKMPAGVKKLIKEVGELEKDMGLRASEEFPHSGRQSNAPPKRMRKKNSATIENGY